MTEASVIERALDRLRARVNRYGEAWQPQFPRTVGAPPPLPGEAFSSWSWRTACRLRCAQGNLLKQWELPLATFWIDAGRIPFQAEPVAATLGIAPGSLRPFEGPQRSDLALSELACLTTEPLFRRPIYRYCSACLNSDAVPYIRHRWRLACGYLCPTHHLVLRDHCPSCRTRLDLSGWPIRYARRVNPDQLLRYCPFCGHDLGEVKPVTLPEDLEVLVLARQAEMTDWVAALLPAWPAPLEVALAGLERSADGVVDPHSHLNALALQVGLDGLCEQREQEDVARVRLRDRIRVIRGTPEDAPASPTLAAALDGQRLFGEAAASLGFYLRYSNTITGGTFWNPSEEALVDDRAEGFSVKEVRAGLAWIEQRQCSVSPPLPAPYLGKVGRQRPQKPST